MIYLLSIGAAFLCAVCDGVAAILQKISVDRQPHTASLRLSYLKDISKDWPFLLGGALDMVGAVVIIAAVYYLPLFLAEAIIATSIIITALLERFYLHRVLAHKTYGYIALMFIGIVLLAIAAAPDRARHLSYLTTWFILIAPLPVFLFGLLLAKMKSYRAGVWLAILAGVEFGLTTIASRIFAFFHPWWHLLYSPYIWSIIAGGLLGISLFAVALQRAHATVINAALTSTKIIVPTVIGISLLGDRARTGFWPIVLLGLVVTSAAAVLLTIQQPQTDDE